MQDLIDHQLVPLHLAILSMKGFASTQNLVRQKPLQLSKVSIGGSLLLATCRFRWRFFVFFTLKVFFWFRFGILTFLSLKLLLLRSARFCFRLCFDGPGICTVIRSDWKLFAARAIRGGTCLQRVTTWLSWTSSLVKSHRSFRSSVLSFLTILSVGMQYLTLWGGCWRARAMAEKVHAPFAWHWPETVKADQTSAGSLWAFCPAHPKAWVKNGFGKYRKWSDCCIP